METLKIYLKDKKSDVEYEDYEYTFTGKKGRKFHVKVHREIVPLAKVEL